MTDTEKSLVLEALYFTATAYLQRSHSFGDKGQIYTEYSEKRHALTMQDLAEKLDKTGDW